MSLIIQTYNRFPSRILYVFILELLLNVLSILAVCDKFYALKLISFGFFLHYFVIKKKKKKKNHFVPASIVPAPKFSSFKFFFPGRGGER